jgi:DNA-binding response OmpR family regulator
MTAPTPVALLVEDEPQIRRFVRTALEAEGWTVHATWGCPTATASTTSASCAPGRRCR